MDLTSLLQDKTILITGGTGSFGQAFTKKILKNYLIKKMIVFSRDEWKQWEMKQTDPIFNHPKIRYFIGDIRDFYRLLRAFHEVDFIVHAAALKQIPAAEYNPSEFVKTNVLGAMNIINASIDCGVKKVIALSTDKAVNPVNLYGATKLCSDKLFIAGNSYVGARGYPIFSIVRYGNVFGSRGSIVPSWRKKIQEGATSLSITDQRMTRFFITLDHAVDFVLFSLLEGRGGEIYIPKIPSVKIVDLAKTIAPDLPLEISGIREGEKLHEVLMNEEEARFAIDYDDHYMVIPATYTSPVLPKKFLEGREGKRLPEGFLYCSSTNTQWLSPEILKKMLSSLYTQTN